MRSPEPQQVWMLVLDNGSCPLEVEAPADHLKGWEQEDENGGNETKEL